MNLYIGLRTWQSLHLSLFFSPITFGLLMGTLTILPVAGRLRSLYRPHAADRLTALVSSYWLAAAYYATLLWLATDAAIWGVSVFFPLRFVLPPYLPGLTVWSTVSGLLLYGTWNALHPVIRHHTITIAKSCGPLTDLHAVLVSDIHLGPLIDNSRLRAMIERINALEPDIVFLAGDIIDENVVYFAQNKMPETLRALKSRFGAFAVLGNHEYLGGFPDTAVQLLEQAGIRVLRDQSVLVNDSFWLVGRDDRMRYRLTGKPRRPLEELMEGLDVSRPVLLLDHQPVNLAEPCRQKVDLQLSGHTHRGQFFPNNLVTKRIFEVDWGYYRKQDFQIIVSSGYATWGPPIRIGSRPELVDIRIQFTNKKDR
ncbi:metallophosphoesterase [Lucifera butyrica]|nr:metallophosphoesterase [Lucifera butyrica]